MFVHVFLFVCVCVCFCMSSKSPTGVDWFILDTEPGYAVKIHRVVDYWAKHIVEQVKNIPSGSSARSVPVSVSQGCVNWMGNRLKVMQRFGLVVCM